MDPRDYDTDELRESSSVDAFGRVESVVSAEALQAQLYRELLILQSKEAPLDKPYLDSLPVTHEGEMAILEWLEYLVEIGGFKRTYDALRYYQSVGWITEGVERRLHVYLAGFTEPPSGSTRILEQSDHYYSLIYIGRLSSL